MPTLQSHTHCQAALANRTSQSLSKSVSSPTHGRKESTGIQSSRRVTTYRSPLRLSHHRTYGSRIRRFAKRWVEF